MRYLLARVSARGSGSGAVFPRARRRGLRASGPALLVGLRPLAILPQAYSPQSFSRVRDRLVSPRPREVAFDPLRLAQVALASMPRLAQEPARALPVLSLRLFVAAVSQAFALRAQPVAPAWVQALPPLLFVERPRRARVGS